MVVLFHTFYCSFGRAEENRSLYRGLRYIERVNRRAFCMRMRESAERQ